MDPASQRNRALWDAWARIHYASAFYDVPAFLAGGNTLNRLEVAELGDVAGRSLLHLQCHFGLDTLSWARLGARVTGVDFSPDAIARARDLAERSGLPARFVESDIYELARHDLGTFERVFTSYGVLSWLPDLERWGNVVADHLRPGGAFHMVEFHPIVFMLDDDGERVRWPYLATGEPIPMAVEGSYAAPDAEVTGTSFEWSHGVGEVVTALLEAGLRLEWLREHPRSPYDVLPYLERRPEGDFGVRGGGDGLPLLFSLKAVKPG
ncbi:MAG TPA: class I SAM-dependent methyltransferase [Longimicrobiales bacterium]|nr:class I SAM-dependent methyltransferase [Longimicrobiales bacterium]